MGATASVGHPIYLIFFEPEFGDMCGFREKECVGHSAHGDQAIWAERDALRPLQRQDLEASSSTTQLRTNKLLRGFMAGIFWNFSLSDVRDVGIPTLR